MQNASLCPTFLKKSYTYAKTIAKLYYNQTNAVLSDAGNAACPDPEEEIEGMTSGYS